MQFGTNDTASPAANSTLPAHEQASPRRSGSPVTSPYRNEQFPDPRRRWSEAERESLDRLLPVIHVDLLKVAMALVQRDQPDERLEATGLVQAALIRLAQRHGGQWRSRVEFFRWTATIMRHVLVDQVRSQQRADAVMGAETDARQVGLALMTVDDALRRLEQMERLHEDFVATAPMPPRSSRDSLR